jgi:glycosyltransferase involved in cell wall biosynthesis
VFNGERHIQEALDSLLAQTYRRLKSIVADDGSTDRTAEVVVSFQGAVCYLKQNNAGPATARNSGISVHRYFCDDLWHLEKLERQLARFQARPELDYCVTHAQNFWIAEMAAEAEKSQRHRISRPLPGYVTQTPLARRALFDRVGDFDTSRRVGDPADWFLRVAEQGAVMELLPDVLVYRRFHENNFSVESDTRRMKPSMQDAILEVVKASLDRRRGQSSTGPMPLSFPPADRDKKT